MKPNILLVVLDSVRARNTSLHGYTRKTTPFLEEFSRSSSTYRQARAPGMTSLPSHTSMFTGYHVEEHGVHDSILHKTEPGITVWNDLRQKGYTTGVFSSNVNLIDTSSSLRAEFDYASPTRRGLFPRVANHEDFRNEYEYDSAGINEYLSYFYWSLKQEHPVSTILNGLSEQISKRINSARLEQAIDGSANRCIDLFFDWIDERNSPWAACINLMDAHHAYYPKSRFDEWGGEALQRKQSKLAPHPWEVQGGEVDWEDWMALEDLYDGTIRQLDASMESLISGLRRRGVFDDTLLVITSDHGECFGETSRVRPQLRLAGHIAGLHESLLHVPLLVSYPGQDQGDTIDSLASLTEFPTVVNAVLNGSWTGREFVPDGPVIASGSNIENKLKNTNRAAKYVNNTEEFAGIIRALYRQEDDEILKYMMWGNDTATVAVHTAQESSKLSESVPSTEVDDVFDSLDDANVLVRRHGGVDDSTKQRLSDLGYV